MLHRSLARSLAAENKKIPYRSYDQIRRQSSDPLIFISHWFIFLCDRYYEAKVSCRVIHWNSLFLSSINQEIVQRESSVSWSNTNYGTSYSSLIYRHVPETQTSVKLAWFIRRGHAKTDYIRRIGFFFFLPYFILISLVFFFRPN